MTIVVSINIRSLGGKGKYLSLRDFLKKLNPSIICIQESMHLADHSIVVFCSMFQAWNIAAWDALGHSRGEIILWNPIVAMFKAFSFFGGTLIIGHCRGHRNMPHIINLYAHDQERRIFWDWMDRSEILSLSNLIIAGDFNSSLHPDDIWGRDGRADPLENHLRSLFSFQNICDLKMDDSSPMWYNCKNGDATISKRLDRFLIKEDLVDRIPILR